MPRVRNLHEVRIGPSGNEVEPLGDKDYTTLFAGRGSSTGGAAERIALLQGITGE
ncbi:hypothetical protein Pan216_13770 [Planctomycetes bacterium Pan216]|uniref:Uncharacterized protein n=1 Tax=Kolteria novifilia TaxID=2527975 RepID=A0A518B0P2_9BACT|nr:hypothetical protein Pan216_13770 [Planctomycetes bacterium Pan216]